MLSGWGYAGFFRVYREPPSTRWLAIKSCSYRVARQSTHFTPLLLFAAINAGTASGALL